MQRNQATLALTLVWVLTEIEEVRGRKKVRRDRGKEGARRRRWSGGRLAGGSGGGVPSG